MILADQLMKTVNTEMNVETVTEVIEVDLVAKEEIVDLVVVVRRLFDKDDLEILIEMIRSL